MTTQPTPINKQGFDYGPLLQILIAEFAKNLPQLIGGLLDKIHGDEKDVIPVAPVNPNPPGMDEGEDIQPAPIASRTPSKLTTKVFWIARKNTPYRKGGGRFLLSQEAKNRVVYDADPLQAGDRVCFDDTPYDQNGVKYEGEKPLTLEHHVGGVGEIQQQEENDYTPIVFVPWEGSEVKPGFEGSISYHVTGGGLTSNTISLRVKPWKA